MTNLLPLFAVCFFQAGEVRNLSASERTAMETITQSKVLSTVSFLSSDEMAGRDTPSPELQIASAYVAARFRGAGLEGLGDRKSFYQNTTVKTVMAPNSALFGSESSKMIELMAAGKEAVRFQGVIGSAEVEGQLNGPVYMAEPSFPANDPRTPMRAMSSVVRRATRLKRAGATALLVVCAENSPLIPMARQSAGRPKMLGRRALVVPLPILLVDAVPTGRCQLNVPAQREGKAVVRNVIGVLRGSDDRLKDEAIIFSAHLDHIGRAGGTDPVNNGADDDASGVTAVLALADAYGKLKVRPKRSIIFMTFWGEEKGLLGSRYYAQNPTWPLKRIVANINIEMVGRPERGAQNKAWMTGWSHSNLGPLMAIGAKRAGVTIFNHRRFGPMLYTQSDNASFVRVGVIAHSFSAGSLHADYHKPGDEWNKLEIPHMTTVVRGLFAGSLPLANGMMTPVSTP